MEKSTERLEKYVFIMEKCVRVKSQRGALLARRFLVRTDGEPFRTPDSAQLQQRLFGAAGESPNCGSSSVLTTFQLNNTH